MIRPFPLRLLLPVLLVSLFCRAGQEVAMDCANGAASQSDEVRGPEGVVAVVRLSSSDDAGKNSHDCLARYQLLIRRSGEGNSKASELLSSDGDWSRRLSASLDGFSRDGKRLFGIISESGTFPLATLFEYNAVSGQMALIDLQKTSRQLKAAGCGLSLAVAGTTDAGGVVLGVRPACSASGLWIVDAKTGVPHHLAKDTRFTALYREKAP